MASGSSPRRATQGVTSRSRCRRMTASSSSPEGGLHGRRVGGRARPVSRVKQGTGSRRLRPLAGAPPRTGARAGPFRSRPAVAAADRILTRLERSGVSLAGRARRGTSGALYLQSAPAGPNPPEVIVLVGRRTRDVEDRVPRSGEPRTVSGPEGSSTQRPSSGAAERPGPSRSFVWARGRSDRRRVHGMLSGSRAKEGRDVARPPSGPLPALASADVQPDRRPGGGRRDPPQRGSG